MQKTELVCKFPLDKSSPMWLQIFSAQNASSQRLKSGQDRLIHVAHTLCGRAGHKPCRPARPSSFLRVTHMKYHCWLSRWLIGNVELRWGSHLNLKAWDTSLRWTALIYRNYKCLANAKRPCDCHVLCLRLKSSLCSCAHSISDMTSFGCRDMCAQCSECQREEI